MDAAITYLISQGPAWALLALAVWRMTQQDKALNEAKDAHLTTLKEVLPIAEAMKKHSETAVSVVQDYTVELQIERASRERTNAGS